MCLKNISILPKKSKSISSTSGYIPHCLKTN